MCGWVDYSPVAAAWFVVVVPGLWSCLVVVGPRVCVGVVCELDSVFVCLQFVLFLCLFLFLSFLVGVARLFPWLFPGGGWVVLFRAVLFLFGEFDPGSGRTLAACLTHASRTMMRRLRR